MLGNKLLKKSISVATAVILLIAVAFDVHAASSVPVLESQVGQDTISLYLKYAGEDTSAAVHVGTEAGDDAKIEKSDAFPIVTWLLLDNSISISNGDRDKAKALFSDLVAGRSSNEVFNLCTYDEHLNILIEESADYGQIKSQIDAIQHIDQESYLTDVLTELLDKEESRQEEVFYRIVVVCDGVDNNPGGITRDELDRRLEKKNVPIYTLGCERNGNEQLLKELYSLSRETAALNWSLTDLSDPMEVSRTLSGPELPARATFTIPDRMCDGSEKGIQLTFSDGSTASTQAVMPFHEVSQETDPEPQTPVVQPLPPEPEPEPEPEQPDRTGLYVTIGVVAVILVAAVAAFLVLRKKKQNNVIQPVSDSEEDEEDETDLLENQAGGDTNILVKNNRNLRVILTDADSPEHHFEVPLRGKVTIGRESDNKIVLDYDRFISKHHCEIYQKGSSFRIRDLRSANKTLVDGIEVVDEAEIVNGCTITLGRLNFKVGIR